MVAVPRHERYVGAHAGKFRAGRRNIVCSNVVRRFQADLRLQILLQRIRHRQRPDIGPPQDLNLPGLFRRKRLYNHGIVFRKDLRFLHCLKQHRILAHDVFSRRKGSRNGRRRRRFRTDQIDFRRRTAGPSFKIPVGGAHRHSIGCRRLPDARSRGPQAISSRRTPASSSMSAYPSRISCLYICLEETAQVQLTSSWTCLPLHTRAALAISE